MDVAAEPVEGEETMKRTVSPLAMMAIALGMFGQNAYAQSAAVSEITLGGRLMNDWGWFAQSPQQLSQLGDIQDGTEFRRARLGVAGTLQGGIKFKAEYDFAGTYTSFKDVWIEVPVHARIGNVRVGHQKEPFGLEELTSSKYITFMERASTATFVPSRNNGITLFGKTSDAKLSWSAGVFRSTNGYGDGVADGKYNYTARLVALPLYSDGGSQVVHFGAATSYRRPTTDSLRYKSRPEAHLAPNFVDTDPFAADRARLFGGEAAWVQGSFSMQGEYVAVRTRSLDAGNYSFNSYYAQTSFLLTGEHRPYKKGAGVFSGVKPNSPFGDGGFGALEIAARFSSIDLTDSALPGGELSNMAVGLNWYANAHTRVMANYIRSNVESVGTSDSFTMRFQVHF